MLRLRSASESAIESVEEIVTTEAVSDGPALSHRRAGWTANRAAWRYCLAKAVHS
jgi:hypothetical protein